MFCGLHHSTVILHWCLVWHHKSCRCKVLRWDQNKLFICYFYPNPFALDHVKFNAYMSQNKCLDFNASFMHFSHINPVLWSKTPSVINKGFAWLHAQVHFLNFVLWIWTRAYQLQCKSPTIQEVIDTNKSCQ